MHCIATDSNETANSPLATHKIIRLNNFGGILHLSFGKEPYIYDLIYNTRETFLLS